MIEGLRLLPRLHEAARKSPDAVGHLTDCDRCRSILRLDNRRALACGWEPRLAYATPWTPEDWDEEPPTTCAGYTTRLPEVREVAEARFYLKHGSLSVLVKDELTEGLRVGIQVLENAEAEVISWAAKNRK